jgi:hypothetical protein
MPYFTNHTTSYESRRDILASSNGLVIATYTVDTTYATEVTLNDGESRKVIWAGTVMALRPSNSKAVPNYTTYGFTALGVLLQDADVQDGDEVAPIVFRGDVIEDYCSDNGTFGTVLSATKTALADRIQFTVQPRL